MIKDLAELEGHEYLVKLTKFSTTIRQAIEYSRIVYDMHIRRELIKISENYDRKCFKQNIRFARK